MGHLLGYARVSATDQQPAISGALPGGQRPPAAYLCASAVHPAAHQPLAAHARGAEAQMGSVTWGKRGHRHQVSWRLEDGTQGATTLDSADEPATWPPSNA